MLLNLLIGGLAVVGACVVVALVLASITYVIMSRRLSIKLRQTVEELELKLAEGAFPNRFAASDVRTRAIVPPMRIQVMPWTGHDERLKSELSQRIDGWLQSHSFDPIGVFFIVEMVGELMEVYLSQDKLLVAAVRYQIDRQRPYVEFLFDLGRRSYGGVSNPPGAAVPLPPDAIGQYLQGEISEDFGLLSRMWLSAKELIDQHTARPLQADQVAGFFEQAHAAEMDARVATGGVSETEIRAAFAAQGDAATEADVEEIQRQWQEAIEKHLLDYSSRGVSQVDAGREILVVYDGSVTSYLLARICQMLDDIDSAEREPLVGMASELKQLLKRFSPREAMARFRPLLPLDCRYDLIDQLKKPVEADLYSLPQ